MAEAAPFLADWPEGGATRMLEPITLPVCGWLDGIAPKSVIGAIRAEAGRLQRRQTYGVGEFGEGFLDGYGWSEFVGLRGPAASERIACGVLLPGPGVVYPAHQQEAEEVYLPVRRPLAVA